MVAQLLWKCYSCEHIGPESDFPSTLENVNECNRSEFCGEDIFPHRTYICDGCGHIFTQDDQWPEYDLDQDPIEHKFIYYCCVEMDEDGNTIDGCSSKTYSPYNPEPEPATKKPKIARKPR